MMSRFVVFGRRMLFPPSISALVCYSDLTTYADHQRPEFYLGRTDGSPLNVAYMHVSAWQPSREELKISEIWAGKITPFVTHAVIVLVEACRRRRT